MAGTPACWRARFHSVQKADRRRGVPTLLVKTSVGRGVGAQVLPECLNDDSRQRDDAHAGLGLGWPEERLAAVDVDELPVDEDGAALEVEAVDGEAEDLALAQASSGGQDHERVVPPRHVLHDGGELVFGRWVGPWAW